MPYTGFSIDHKKAFSNLRNEELKYLGDFDLYGKIYTGNLYWKQSVYGERVSYAFT